MGAPARPSLSLGTVALVLALAGCRNLDRFDTDGPPAYCGSIVGAGSFHKGFIAEGAPPSLGLHLEIDTDSLTSRPGSLSSDDRETGLCSGQGEPLFDGAPLRAIDEVLHDAIAHAEFGNGHEQDVFAWVDSTCQGTMLAIVSLLTNGAVEVRLFKPKHDTAPEAPASEQAGFALFYLERSEKGCDF